MSFPNRRTLSMREAEENQAIKEEASDEEFEEEDHTLDTLDVR